MSAEFLNQLYQERLNDLIKNIPWPKIVYTNDLAQITNYRSRLKSLGAAVSLHISNEAYEINQGLATEASRYRDRQFRLQVLPVIAPIFIAYEMPAQAILAAEAFIGGDFSEKKIGLDLSNLVSTSKSLEEVMQQYTSSTSPITEKIITIINEVCIAGQLGSEVIAELLANRLTRGVSFPELVNFYCDLQLQQFKSSKGADLPATQTLVDGFEYGRERFHQLFKTALEFDN